MKRGLLTECRVRRWGLGVVLGLLAAAPFAQTPGDEVLVPNAQLQVQDIPPIPLSLVQRVARYTDFRGHALVAWHPTRHELLVSHRQAGASVPQLYRLQAPLGALESMTGGAEPVSRAAYEPRQARYLVYQRSSGGNEANQIYRLDLPGRQSTLLTQPDQASEAVGWIQSRSVGKPSLLLYTTLPLDRTAQAGKRESVGTSLWSIDPLAPETSRRKIVELEGTGWLVGGVSSDGRRLSLTRSVSANGSQVWVLDLDRGYAQQVLPEPGVEEDAAYRAGPFSKDGKRLYLTTDRGGEYRELHVLDLSSRRLRRIRIDVQGDVQNFAATSDDRYLALTVNINGRDELRILNGRTLRPMPVRGMPAGSVRALVFQPDGHLLAFTVVSQKGPGQIHVLDPTTGRTSQWTSAYAPPGVDTQTFADQQVIQWESFDGLALSGLLTRPPTTFSGKRPVIVVIHGGPAAQATMGFMNRWNYFVQELGVAIVEPNVRGSLGYGKTFLSLDDGYKRQDAVRDIGSLLDWITAQPDLDSTRVMVTGGSYGGYMTLATSVAYADRIAASVAIVPPSNLVSFLTNTESYRRDLRRVEYGDERDPATRAFLESIAPLNHAEKIKKPLFVVQGKNDPRVHYSESEQMVAKVREAGQTVWYLRAENEGHGFVRKENSDFLFYANVKFVEEFLLKP